MFHHLGPDRVQLDVAVAGQDVVLALGEAGPEATLPKRSRSLVGAVDVLHIALPEVLHHEGGAVFSLRGDQQVNVVGHQDIGVNQAAVLVGLFLQ